jgi:hypothetical protein
MLAGSTAHPAQDRQTAPCCCIAATSGMQANSRQRLPPSSMPCCVMKSASGTACGSCCSQQGWPLAAPGRHAVCVMSSAQSSHGVHFTTADRLAAQIHTSTESYGGTKCHYCLLWDAFPPAHGWACLVAVTLSVRATCATTHMWMYSCSRVRCPARGPGKQGTHVPGQPHSHVKHAAWQE